MAEKISYLPQQYQKLFEDSIDKIRLAPAQIHSALEGIRTGKKIDQFYALMLLKEIASGQFPFIILLNIDSDFSHSGIDKPDSVSLIPDPSQISITSNGEKVNNVFSHIIGSNTNITDQELMDRVSTCTRSLLMRQPLERPDLKPRSVAIGRRNTYPIDRESLSFGLPILDVLNKIQMGSLISPLKIK